RAAPDRGHGGTRRRVAPPDARRGNPKGARRDGPGGAPLVVGGDGDARDGAADGGRAGGRGGTRRAHGGAGGPARPAGHGAADAPPPSADDPGDAQPHHEPARVLEEDCVERPTRADADDTEGGGGEDGLPAGLEPAHDEPRRAGGAGEGRGDREGGVAEGRRGGGQVEAEEVRAARQGRDGGRRQARRGERGARSEVGRLEGGESEGEREQDEGAG
ncbi:hypothetical protein THAOC_37336, partial [Thalassiosira oceanica]